MIVDSGTVSSTGAGTFTDSGKAWDTDEHIGRTVKNTTTNKSGRITDNDGTTITTTVGFTATDTYEIIETAMSLPEYEIQQRPNLEDQVMGQGTESDRIGRNYGVD